VTEFPPRHPEWTAGQTDICASCPTGSREPVSWGMWLMNWCL